MNSQTQMSEINELKAEIMELNRMKIQEAVSSEFIYKNFFVYKFISFFM